MPRPIVLTYTVHPTQGPQREYLTDALTGMQAQLPLRNLHWKSPTRTALRTIQEVDVQLMELGEVGPPREVGGSVLEGALVNLCFIACDVSRLLVYLWYTARRGSSSRTQKYTKTRRARSSEIGSPCCRLAGMSMPHSSSSSILLQPKIRVRMYLGGTRVSSGSSSRTLTLASATGELNGPPQ